MAPTKSSDIAIDGTADDGDLLAIDVDDTGDDDAFKRKVDDTIFLYVRDDRPFADLLSELETQLGFEFDIHDRLYVEKQFVSAHIDELKRELLACLERKDPKSDYVELSAFLHNVRSVTDFATSPFADLKQCKHILKLKESGQLKAFEEAVLVRHVMRMVYATVHSQLLTADPVAELIGTT